MSDFLADWLQRLSRFNGGAGGNQPKFTEADAKNLGRCGEALRSLTKCLAEMETDLRKASGSPVVNYRDVALVLYEALEMLCEELRSGSGAANELPVAEAALERAKEAGLLW